MLPPTSQRVLYMKYKAPGRETDMAEEVITSWSNMLELIDELTATGADSQKARRLIRDIPSRFSMAFEVRDGNGNPVVWPLTVISDTTPRT